MPDATEILVIFLSVFLAMFLLLGIILLVMLISVTRRIMRLTAAAQSVAERVDAMTTQASRVTTPLIIAKMVWDMFHARKK